MINIEYLVAKAEAKWDELKEDGVASKFIGLFVKHCPKCGDVLDYNHIGYKGDRGYCHSCGWRSDREENK